ncbi:luciferase domain-containing protein [Streptomyces mirabilis]
MAHFHSDLDVGLHLTARAIRRFEDHPTNASAVRLVPGSQWVTLHLEVAADIDLLMILVSLALQTHQAWPVPGDGPRTRCNDQHSEALPHEQRRLSSTLPGRWHRGGHGARRRPSLYALRNGRAPRPQRERGLWSDPLRVAAAVWAAEQMLSRRVRRAASPNASLICGSSTTAMLPGGWTSWSGLTARHCDRTRTSTKWCGSSAPLSRSH